MQQKLETELMSLAHSILKMKKGDDVKILTEKAKNVYERLAVLSFIERYYLETPQNTKSKQELIEEAFGENATENNSLNKIATTAIVSEDIEETNTVTEDLKDVDTLNDKPLIDDSIINQEKDIEELANAFEPIHKIEESIETKIDTETQAEENEIFAEPVFNSVENTADIATDVEENESSINKELTENQTDLQSSLEKEFGTTISLEETTDLFENAQRVTPKKTLNDIVMQQKSLQIDLNDRIAFVKHLFDNSHEDFNRVISQLNTMETEKEAISFIKMIKKEYNWDGKEVYQERLLLIVERKFS